MTKPDTRFIKQSAILILALASILLMTLEHLISYQPQPDEVQITVLRDGKVLAKYINVYDVSIDIGPSYYYFVDSTNQAHTIYLRDRFKDASILIEGDGYEE